MIEKIGFFEQFGVSFLGLFKPSNLGRLRKQTMGKTIGFAIIMSLLCMFASFGILSIRFVSSNALKDLVAQFPEFTYLNGQLEVDGAHSFESGDQVLYIDTSINYMSTDDFAQFIVAKTGSNLLGNFKSYMFFTKTNIVQYKSGQFQDISLSDIANIFKISYLDKSNFANKFNSFIVKILMIICAFACPFYAVLFFISSFLFALVGKVIGAITHTSLSFGEHFRIGVFASAYITLLTWIILGFAPSAGTIVRLCAIIVVIVYMVFAIKASEAAMNSFEAAASSSNVQVVGGSYVIQQDDIKFEAPPISPINNNYANNSFNANAYSNNESNYNTNSGASSNNDSAPKSTSGFKLKD